MRHAAVIGLAGGAGCLAAGVALGATLSFEAGAALALLGAAGLGAGAAARAIGGDSAPEAPAVLEQRLEELRALDARLTAAGVSPVERTYHDLLRTRAETARPEDLDERERRLAEMIRNRCDRVWEGIREQWYVRREGADGRIAGPDYPAVFAELRSIVQEVAALHHAESDDAVLEARAGDIALAVRAVVGELLETAQQAPFVDPAGWSIQTLMTRLDQARQGLALYQKLSPYQNYLNGALFAARLAAGTNPVSLVAWTVGTEVAKRAGKQLVKSQAEVWLKTLLESAVALIYLRTAGIYDPRRAYRGPEWIALAEAVRIHACVPGIDHNRRRLLDRVLRAPIPDEFAKMALLRALAEDRAPAPPSIPAVDLDALRPADRQAVGERLADLLSEMRGLQAPDAKAAIEALQRRLPFSVDLSGADRPEAGRAADGFALLAALARDGLEADREETGRLLRASVFYARVGEALDGGEADRLAARATAAAYEARRGRRAPMPDAPPLALVGDALARPLLTSVVDLLDAAPLPWPVEHDQLVLLYASVLLSERKHVEAAWQHYVEAASRRLRERLRLPDLSTWPPRAAPAILRGLGAGDEPALAVLAAATPAGRARWLAFERGRVAVGAVPDKALAIDDAEPEVHAIGPGAPARLARRRGYVTDDLVLRCGDHALTVAGALIGNFEGRFGPLLRALDLDAERLENDG